MKQLLTFLAALSAAAVLDAQDYKLNDKGYFNYEGVDAMATMTTGGCSQKTILTGK